ncbi:putative nitrilase [Mytilinidion resinicola]|uniref:Nitrilase n=1 Tax=Mytilinidion resinicola TaxID=574789 RepID=A0A6A6YZA9_9PEZI|nr:putative nitrilase [Mytilinidion resinicola]KAF2813265.1 putative nitrilase [Mytilinidion resinicola]
MAIAAVGQICSTASMTHNLSQCVTLIQKAASAGAKALFLPEASDYIAPTAAETISLVQPASTSPFVLGLRSAARAASLPISVGIHEPSTSSKRVKNILIWIDANGEIAHRYQKLHLFDVEIKDGPILKESNSVEPGMEIPEPFDSAVGKVGSMICFDLRFPEISLALRKRGAQLLLYPSAFTVPTGIAHWSTLLRARAVETQSYVIAAAQCGMHNEAGTRRSYGHSVIVDPWGKVIAELGGAAEDGSWKEPEIAVADIDLDYLEKVRREMPLLRRTDVYPEIK